MLNHSMVEYKWHHNFAFVKFEEKNDISDDKQSFAIR